MEATKVLQRGKALAPKLRFKEFKEGWENRKIGDLGSFIGGGTPTTSVEKYWIGDIPWISSSDLFEDDLNNINIHRYLNKEAISESATKVIPKNSVLIISRVGVGKLAVNKTELCTSQDFSNFIPTECNSYFIAYYLLARKNLLINFAQGTSIKGFTTSDIKSLKVSIPILPEQQKIASFLSALDKKIQQLSRKKQLLAQYKKGAMQHLFSGKLMFKDANGKSFPKWEEKLYGDVYSFYSTNPFSRDNLNYKSGSVKNIHYGDIHTKFTTLFDVTRETVPFINSEIDISRINQDNYCKEGDLVIADASEDYADIGKTVEIVELNNEKVIAGLHTFLARPNKIKMHKGFSGHLVKASYVRKQIMTIAQGTKVLSLSTGRLGNVKMNIPCIDEQKKIANFLSIIDNKIENVNKQIIQTQTFKKGLLQQMFV